MYVCVGVCVSVLCNYLISTITSGSDFVTFNFLIPGGSGFVIFVNFLYLAVTVIMTLFI